MSKLINEGLRDWYADVDWKALRREDLGSGTLVEGNGNFDRIKTVFNIFLDIKPNQLSTDLVQRLDAKLEEFKILVNEIYSYSDIRQRKNVLTLISGFEYRFVNELGNHIAYYTNLFKEQNEQKVDTAELKKTLKSELINELIGDEEKIRGTKEIIDLVAQNIDMLSSAVDGAKQWLHANKEVVDNISKKNAKDARRKAMDHSTFKDVKYVDNFLITKLPIISHLARLICWIFPDLRFIKKIPIFRGTFWWLLGSFAFGTIVLCIIAYFVFYVKDPTVPEIILKLSAVIVPSYFAVFCTNQYMNHRRLYENYMFKDVALTTMLNLRGQYAEGSSSNTLILEKSLGVIFNEPIMTVSEMKVDRNVLKDIIEILKK